MQITLVLVIGLSLLILGLASIAAWVYVWIIKFSKEQTRTQRKNKFDSKLIQIQESNIERESMIEEEAFKNNNVVVSENIELSKVNKELHDEVIRMGSQVKDLSKAFDDYKSKEITFLPEKDIKKKAKAKKSK